MGLRIDNSIFPQIPQAPGPGALESPIPGQEQREQGPEFGAGPPPSFGDLQQEPEEAPPEQLNFGDVLAAGGQARKPEPSGLSRPPGRPKSDAQVIDESLQMVDDALNDMTANLGTKEREAADRGTETENTDLLLEEMERSLGLGPAVPGQAPPPAGDDLLRISQDQAVRGEDPTLGDLPEVSVPIRGPGGVALGEVDTGFTLQEGESPTESVKRNFLDFWNRFRSGLGRTKKEQLTPFIGAFGRENVRVKNGEIEVRRPGDKGFRQVDSEQFEFFGDLFADLSGPILETAIGAATEAGILLTAGGATLASGGGAAPATIPALLGAGAAGGTAGSLGREGMIQAIDSVSDAKQRDEAFNLKSDVLWSAGIGAGSFGAAGLIKGGAKMGAGFLSSKLKPLIDDFVSRSPIKRAESIGKILAATDDFLQRMGAKPKEAFGPAGTTKTISDTEGFSRAARDAHGAVAEMSEQLTKEVSLIRNEVIEKAGDRKFSVQTALQKQKEILEDSDRIIFDPKTGEALVTRETTTAAISESSRAQIQAAKKLSSRKSVASEGASAVDDVSASISQGAVSAERRGISAVAPQATPDKALNEMAAQYNLLRKCQQGQGGCSAATVFNTIDTYNDFAKFFKGDVNALALTNAERKARSTWSSVGNALRSDRDAMVDGLVKEFPAGSPVNQHWKGSFKRFHENIDQITDFTSEFQKSGSARAWAEAIFRPNNGKQIRQLQDVLGVDSPQWKALKGEWMADLVRNSTDPATGLLNPDRFRKALNKFERDPDVFKTLMSKKERQEFVNIVDGLAEISTDDLVGPRKIRNWVKDMLLLWQNVLPTTRANIISTYLSKNTRMTPEIMNSLIDTIRTTKDLGKKDKLGWMQTINTVREVFDQSGIVKIKRKNPKTGKVSEMEIFVPLRPVSRARETAARGIQRAVSDPAELGGALAQQEPQPEALPVSQ